MRLHLKPRWGGRRLDSIDVSDAVELVRELRAEGLAEWTISGICRAASRIFKFARRHCGWVGENPFALLDAGERPKVSTTPERRIYQGEEFAQTLAASSEPWTTLFRLASVVAGRESELLGLWWEDLDLRVVDDATIRFGFQVDRRGVQEPAEDRGEQGDVAAATLGGADAARAQGAHGESDRPRVIRLRDFDRKAARPAQRAASAL